MDQILYNGDITTMDANCPRAQAVLIRDGRYVLVGDDQTVLSAAPLADKTDLQGAAVYPGLIDSHLHILNLAITSRELEMGGIFTRQGVLEAVSSWAQRLPEGATLDGRGFNEDLWDDPRLPTRQELDAVAPHHPVRLTRVCGHMVLANTAAIEQMGITSATSVPEGGEMDLEAGIFNENAIGLLAYREKKNVEDCKQLLYEGMCKAADAGLTGIWTDDFGTGGYDMHLVVEAYRQLEREGRVPLRVIQQCALPDEEDWQDFLRSGFAYGQGSDLYRIGPRKLYADGSLGARTAYLSVPYADRAERQGVPIYSQERLNQLAEETHRAGMPFIVHAIGDAATDLVLNAIDHARQTVLGSECLPSGIVHCQITRPDQLNRIARMGVSVYAQPVFTEYDLHICRDRVGEALEQTSYQWKTLLESGVNFSSGSDCPVEPLDPAKNIYCAVTRKDFVHQPEGGWLPQERLSVHQAIACHTVEAARAVGYEDRLGKIAPGYLADASVYPKAFDQMKADEILSQHPLFTMVGGQIRQNVEKA